MRRWMWCSGRMDRKAEEKAIAELSATTTTPRAAVLDAAGAAMSYLRQTTRAATRRARRPNGVLVEADSGTPASWKWSSLLGHPPGFAERPAQEHLHVGVDAAKLVIGPTHQRLVHCRVKPEEHLATRAHVYNDPVLTTGDGGWSPHSTTMRL